MSAEKAEEGQLDQEDIGEGKPNGAAGVSGSVQKQKKEKKDKEKKEEKNDKHKDKKDKKAQKDGKAAEEANGSLETVKADEVKEPTAKAKGKAKAKANAKTKAVPEKDDRSDKAEQAKPGEKTERKEKAEDKKEKKDKKDKKDKKEKKDKKDKKDKTDKKKTKENGEDEEEEEGGFSPVENEDLFADEAGDLSGLMEDSAADPIKEGVVQPSTPEAASQPQVGTVVQPSTPEAASQPQAPAKDEMADFFESLCAEEAGDLFAKEEEDDRSQKENQSPKKPSSSTEWQSGEWGDASNDDGSATLRVSIGWEAAAYINEDQQRKTRIETFSGASLQVAESGLVTSSTEDTAAVARARWLLRAVARMRTGFADDGPTFPPVAQGDSHGVPPGLEEVAMDIPVDLIANMIGRNEKRLEVHAKRLNIIYAFAKAPPPNPEIGQAVQAKYGNGFFPAKVLEVSEDIVKVAYELDGSEADLPRADVKLKAMPTLEKGQVVEAKFGNSFFEAEVLAVDASVSGAVKIRYKYDGSESTVPYAEVKASEKAKLYIYGACDIDCFHFLAAAITMGLDKQSFESAATVSILQNRPDDPLDQVGLSTIRLEKPGKVIGKQGTTKKRIVEVTGAGLNIPKESDFAIISGTGEQRSICKTLVQIVEKSERFGVLEEECPDVLRPVCSLVRIPLQAWEAFLGKLAKEKMTTLDAFPGVMVYCLPPESTAKADFKMVVDMVVEGNFNGKWHKAVVLSVPSGVPETPYLSADEDSAAPTVKLQWDYDKSEGELPLADIRLPVDEEKQLVRVALFGNEDARKKAEIQVMAEIESDSPGTYVSKDGDALISVDAADVASVEEAVRGIKRLRENDWEGAAWKTEKKEKKEDDSDEEWGSWGKEEKQSDAKEDNAWNQSGKDWKTSSASNKDRSWRKDDAADWKKQDQSWKEKDDQSSWKRRDDRSWDNKDKDTWKKDNWHRKDDSSHSWKDSRNSDDKKRWDDKKHWENRGREEKNEWKNDWGKNEWDKKEEKWRDKEKEEEKEEEQPSFRFDDDADNESKKRSSIWDNDRSEKRPRSDAASPAAAPAVAPQAAPQVQQQMQQQVMPSVMPMQQPIPNPLTLATQLGLTPPLTIPQWDQHQAQLFPFQFWGPLPPEGWIRVWSNSRNAAYFVRLRDQLSVFSQQEMFEAGY